MGHVGIRSVGKEAYYQLWCDTDHSTRPFGSRSGFLWRVHKFSVSGMVYSLKLFDAEIGMTPSLGLVETISAYS